MLIRNRDLENREAMRQLAEHRAKIEHRDRNTSLTEAEEEHLREENAKIKRDKEILASMMRNRQNQSQKNTDNDAKAGATVKDHTSATF